MATFSRIDKIIGLFCRISSLLQGSFAKETYNFIDPTNRSHPISDARALAYYIRALVYGVALVSRIDKMIGLFCKRALQKRRYSAKETYIVYGVALALAYYIRALSYCILLVITRVCNMKELSHITYCLRVYVI